MTTAIAAFLAVALDRWLCEPRRLHPLVGFGGLARRIESRLIGGEGAGARWRGTLAVMLAVAPWTALAWLVAWLAAASPVAEVAVSVLLLYLAIGAQSLAWHGRAVATALAAGDLPLARERVGWIVSRESAGLDEAGVARAAVESVLENGNDALFGALFWFALLGAPGVVLFRLINTLDAMWGYRNARYRDFGWFAAKLDDWLGWLPARLTALAYLLVGEGRRGWRCWQRQAAHCDSPNAGVVMASGAGALNLQLGGPARYHGKLQDKPLLGEGALPQGTDIERAIRLLERALLLWLAVFAVVGVVFG